MKPLALVLLVLVGSMILTSISSQVYADPQLDSLLRIANQARDNIKIRLSQLPTIPHEIAKLYKEGSAETNALAQSVAQGDVTSARQHFLAAMKVFREISSKISDTVTVDPVRPDCIPRMKEAIDRIMMAGESLKALTTKNNVNIDFTEFDNLIYSAKQHLDAKNCAEVTKALELAKQFLLDAQKKILNNKGTRPKVAQDELANMLPPPEDTTRDSKLERIKMKIQTIEEQLNSLSEKVGENEVAAQWLKRAFSLIEKAKDQLDKSPDKAMRTLSEVDKIIRMIQRITH